jgi:hypothetical protein
MAKDEIELADTVMTLKLAVEKIKVRVDYLADALEDLIAAKDAQVPLAAWIDEDLFHGAEMNPAVPFLPGLYNVRAENALRDARHQIPELRVRTTRELLALPHEKVLLWRNVGKKSLTNIVRALERAGVRWPAKGRKT